MFQINTLFQASREQAAKEGLAVKFVRSKTEKENMDEIALDDDEDENEDEDEVGVDKDEDGTKPNTRTGRCTFTCIFASSFSDMSTEIAERVVPDQVFGSLGAKARFEQQRSNS